MLLRKEDKSYLTESLRNIIDFKILDLDFVDHDRPFKNQKEVQHKLKTDEAWTKWKRQHEEGLLREQAMKRKVDKLSD